MNPFIGATASSATFVSGTWTSIVAVPTASNAPPVTVNGPPDDGDDDDDNDSWLIIFGLLGPLIVGTLPASVVVIGAMIPTPIPPPDWTDPTDWTPPPLPPPANGDPNDPDDPDDPDDDDDPSTCRLLTLPPFDLQYDGESGGDGDEEDSRRRRSIFNATFSNEGVFSRALLVKRADRSTFPSPVDPPSY